MVPSKVDKKIKIRSLTVKEVFELALADFDVENPIKTLNGLVTKCSSLVAIQNNIVGLLLLDIFKLSDLECDKDTEERLTKISRIANTCPAIFSDLNDRPDLKEEIEVLYNEVVDEVQPDIDQFIKDKFKIYRKMAIQPSELDKLPYWEYKQYLKLL